MYLPAPRFDEMEPSEEEKLENKGWLQDHLSNVASFSYADLQAMKERGVACFPPSYNILEFFTRMHHGCLVKKVSHGGQGSEVNYGWLLDCSCFPCRYRSWLVRTLMPGISYLYSLG